MVQGFLKTIERPADGTEGLDTIGKRRNDPARRAKA